ncbi:MAG: ArnT family glycosyltransferase [Thermoanaerobaculia bacterium]
MTSLVAGQLLTFLVVALTAYAAGQWITRTIHFRGGLEELAVACTLGIGVIGTLLYLIGRPGLLYRPVVLALGVLIHLAAIPQWRRVATRLRAWWGSSTRGERSSIVLLLILAAAIIPAFVFSLYPPNTYDETCYHLPIASLFVREHAVVFDDTLRFPLFPQLGEMMFSAILMWAGDVRTHVVELLAAVLIALLMPGAFEEHDRHGSYVAAAFWFGNPIVTLYAGASLVDFVVTMFCTLSWIAWLRWNREGEQRWLLVSALAAGFGAATKYTALYFIVAIGVLTFVRGLRDRRWRPAAAFAFVAFLVTCPPYLRNIVETGNPVFPYFSVEFGRSDWTTSIDRHGHRALPDRLLSSPASFLVRPWRVVADREHLAGLPPLSAILFVAAPFAIYGVIRQRSLRVIALVLIVYAYAVNARDVRFLLPVVPFACIATWVGLQPVLARSKNRRLAFAAVAFVATTPALAYAAIKFAQRGPVPVTLDERDTFLGERMPVYRALKYLNETRGSQYSVYVAAPASAHYFAKGRYLGDVMGPYRYSRVTQTRSVSELHAVLRSMRATHLIVDRYWRERTPPPAALSQELKPLRRFDEIELYEVPAE